MSSLSVCSDKALAGDMAVRISQHAMMGLDDVDEELLWRYVLMELNTAGGSPENMKLPYEVVSVLMSQGEYDPFYVQKISWWATIDNRFYTESRKKKARWGFPLEEKSSIEEGFLSMSIEQTKAEIEGRVRTRLFSSWYDNLTACIREDGVNWEPPCENDIELILDIDGFSLVEALKAQASRG